MLIGRELFDFLEIFSSKLKVPAANVLYVCVTVCAEMCEKAIFTEFRDDFVLVELKGNRMMNSTRCFGKSSHLFKTVCYGEGCSPGRMGSGVSLDSHLSSFSSFTMIFTARSPCCKLHG